MAACPTSLGMGASAILLNGVKWEAYPAACFDVGNEPIGREAIGCFEDELDNPWRYNIGSDLNDFGFDIYSAHLQRAFTARRFVSLSFHACGFV